MAEEKQANRTGRRLGLAGAVLAGVVGVVGLSGCVTYDASNLFGDGHTQEEKDANFGRVDTRTPQGYSITLRHGINVSYRGMNYKVWSVSPPNISILSQDDWNNNHNDYTKCIGVPISDLDMMRGAQNNSQSESPLPGRYIITGVDKNGNSIIERQGPISSSPNTKENTSIFRCTDGGIYKLADGEKPKKIGTWEKVGDNIVYHMEK